jgi:outer membrane protein assembly factor BamB
VIEPSRTLAETRMGHPLRIARILRSGGQRLSAAALVLSLCTAMRPPAVVAQVLVLDAAAAPTHESSASGFQVEIDESLQTAFTDFQRHAGRKAWEKAFQSLTEVPSEKRTGMLPDDNGFLISARERIWNALVSLPPEGREAFRLFFEPRARQSFDSLQQQPAKSPAEAQTVVEEIFDQYFLTSVGDNAADLLGDARFEQGRFDEAARCWAAVLEHHPDSDVPEVRLHVKRALALSAAGRKSEFETARRRIAQQHSAATVRLGGRNVNAAEFLGGLEVATIAEPNAGASLPPPSPPSGAPVDVEPLWQVPFLSDRGKKMMDQSIANNYYRNGLETYVPVAAADGERLYCNWLGICFAVDLKTGKLLWRTEKFSQLYARFNDMQQRSVQYEGFFIVPGDGVVMAVSVPPDQLQNWPPSNRLIAYEAATGNVRWTSQTLGALAQQGIAGRPLIVGDEVLVLTHPQGQTQLTLRSLNLADGQELWSKLVGTAEQRTTRSGYPAAPVPNLLRVGRRLYILVNSGALVEFDLKERQTTSIFRFDKPQSTPQDRFFYAYAQIEDTTALHTRGVLVQEDGLLYFKECAGKTLFALDPAARRVAWKRPVTDAAELVAMDDENCYVLSRELVCIDRSTRAMKWSVTLPVAGGGLSAVPAADGILVFTSRGVYEISRDNGDVRRIFRGHDLASVGGSLQVVGPLAVCVSNRRITAYPLTPP